VRILGDENIARSVVDELRAAGHHVVWVVEQNRRAPDIQHIATALTGGLAILTEDIDFARLVTERGSSAPALLLVRLHGLSRQARAERIARAVDAIGAQPSLGSVHVIEARRTRRRSS
jgi:predicted nuclease of predicted toxin-antitoxin system